MTVRRTGPTPVFALWLAVATGSIALASQNRPFTSDLRSLDSVDFVYVLASAVYTSVYAVVGTLVVSRARHLIGWLLIAVSLTWELPLAFEQYAVRTLVAAPGSLPGAPWAAWGANATGVLVIPPLLLILLLFPSGALRTRRWRPVVAATVAASGLLALGQALRPGPLEGNLPSDRVVANPLGIESAAAVLRMGTTVGVVVSLVAGFAGIACLFLRFRSSHGIDRQQIKWLVFVGLATVVVLVADVVAGRVASDPVLHDAVDSIGWGAIVTTVMLGTPLAIGAAILRYHLYDIDRIISRTLTYALVTGALFGAYLLLALGLGDVATSLTGSTDIAVAASTLVVAALFRPVLRRVRQGVDHRFNRTRYSAAQIIDSFAARLREQIDIDALDVELADVVTRTMHPEHVGLWIAPPTRVR